ncbi:MAG: peptidase domain-containing ABC transporter [Reichenbachiella sp.]|uniref:peptidase domain-containing ABC transporter n=1 Tax=Reichenbachiella sp. TaxID=2184521 RepID=UPI0029665028|nr:peptidase domain-containing ABC transporter [Reichenbachiella sp.]MDW3208911.1 peptidase domain-containing ABC transporter [Reichenbachiella sp.]
MANFTFLPQTDTTDCGAACLRMIAKYFGKNLSNEYLQKKAGVNKLGASLKDISTAAEDIGFKSMIVQIPFETLKEEKPFPCILHWQQNHFVVLYRVSRRKVFIADPAIGLVSYKIEEFMQLWNNSRVEGIAILLDPTPEFYEIDSIKSSSKATLTYFSNYLKPHIRLIFQLILGMTAGSLLSLVLPLLTQSLVDVGIQYNNISFIYLVLIAQLMFFTGSTAIALIRSWILLHITTRLNIAVISDFLIKLMNLPISFFDRKNTGDIMQRIRDHDRIKQFLTSSSLNSLFAIFNIIIFGLILFLYNTQIFFTFIIGSAIYFAWILIFLKKRRVIDYNRFAESAASQNAEIQLVQGMQEIKLNNASKIKRWEWERIQTKLFNVSRASLSLDQIQNSGGSFINELKNILILFFSAKEVLDGEMTLGMMLATTQILGQLNSPLQQLITFIQEAQNAQISLERLGEIHNKKDEDHTKNQLSTQYQYDSIIIKNLWFKYEGQFSEWILKDLTLEIPKDKTTAIVGISGSGKTTLIKLLLKFYEPNNGSIHVGSQNLQTLNSEKWRENCGVVMQDGFLFNDTILDNISISSDTPNYDKFINAIEIANIKEYIDSLALGHKTKIGAEGQGLSQGQKQRIMIARAVYKNPDFLIFDEATSALDSRNEKNVTEQIETFSKGRTTIIVAHRLSTVKNADQIVVLDKGSIVELGNHEELTNKKGIYFDLIKNQLELGK